MCVVKGATKRVASASLGSYVQWKGTDADMDFQCTCGATQRYAGYFCYCIRCPECKRVFRLADSIELVVLTSREVRSLGSFTKVSKPDGLTTVAVDKPLYLKKQVWPIKRANVDFKFIYLHFAGTELTLDFDCKCGISNRIDGRDAQYVGCSDCDRIYWANPHVCVSELTGRALRERGGPPPVNPIGR